MAILEALKQKLQISASKLGILNVQKNYRFIQGEGKTSPEADLYVTVAGGVVALELENQQQYADSNVAKYLRWAKEYNVQQRLAIVHVFGPIFLRSNYVSNRRTAKFLGELFTEKMKYLPLDCSKYSMANFNAENPALIDSILSKLKEAIDWAGINEGAK